MGTVWEALHHLVGPVVIVITISVALCSISWLTRVQVRRKPVEDRILELAIKKIGSGPEENANDDEDKQSAEATPIEITLDEIRRLWPTRARLASIPHPLIPAGAIILGAILAGWAGIYVLYVPMVSTAYSKLYEAYCTADAVGQILAKQAGSTNFADLHSASGCNPNDTSQDTSKAHLSQTDVFFLLNSLGLLEPREKTAKDLFNNEPLTNNHSLALALTNPDFYLPGKPTSALLTSLAAGLGAGSDANSGLKPGELTASNAVCRTAGLAAVMAQQPFLLWGKVETLGHALLDHGPTTDVSALIAAAPDELHKLPEAGTLPCTPDSGLRTNGLGGSFDATMPCYLLIACPLIEQPDDKVNDGEIANIALAWASWTPTDPPDPSKQAVIAFMRSISSQASGCPLVRDARIGANFFVGWERMTILIVAAFLTLCLLWQQAMNIVDVYDLDCIRRVRELTKHNSRLMTVALAILRRSLYRHIGRSAPREILAAAIDAARRRTGPINIDYERVHRVSEQELRIMDRGRFFFLAGLPLLPTIGFIGTVHSLIQALAIADNIPRARDAVDQVTAVSDVTSTLSLCFSTTFMALSALLIFAPLDLWQSTLERRVIDETERLLDRNL